MSNFIKLLFLTSLFLVIPVITVSAQTQDCSIYDSDSSYCIMVAEGCTYLNEVRQCVTKSDPVPRTSSSNVINDYYVQPVILVPKNKRNEYRAEYKKYIIDALETVQKFYSDKLEGHTFKFKNEVLLKEVDEVFDLTSIANIGILFQNLKVSEELPINPLITYAVWIIGSENLSPTAIYNEWSGRGYYAILNHHSLEVLDPTFPAKKEINGYGALAHELGHTFGISYTRYSTGHTCSVISPQNCTSDAPKPLPDRKEFDYSIVGGGGGRFPSAGFNNSIHNPDIEILYQSLFINPKRDPAPVPTRSRIANSSSGAVEIISITPNSLGFGETLEIIGKNFSLGGQIYLIPEGDLPIVSISSSEPSVIWSDTSIKLQIPQLATYDYQVNYTVEVNTYSYKKVISFNKLTVKAKNQTRPSFINVGVKATCEDNQPMYRALIVVEDNTGNGLTRGYTNMQGETTLILNADQINSSFINVVALPFSYSGKTYNATPEVIPLSLNEFSFSQIKTVNFRYSNCVQVVSSLTDPLSQKTLSNDTKIIASTSEGFNDNLVSENISSNELTASSIGNLKPLYIGSIQEDGEVKIYKAEDVQEGDKIEIEDKIIKIVKKVTKVKIGEVEYIEDQLDEEIEIDLDDYQSQGYNIPIEILYSDGSVKYLGYHFSFPQVEEPNSTPEEIPEPTVDPDCTESCDNVSECGQNGGDEYCNLESRGGDPDNPDKYACDFNDPSQYEDGCYDK